MEKDKLQDLRVQIDEIDRELVRLFEARMAVIGLTGKGGGRMASMCDYLFDVPHSHTPLIQEMHEAVMHLMCQLIDHYLFENVQALRGA